MRTIELLDKFQGEEPLRYVADRVGYTKAAISAARKSGKLSPPLAAKIAEFIGENPAFWMAVAAAEQQLEPTRTALLEILEDSAEKWRARRDSNPRPLASEAYGFRRAARIKEQKARQMPGFFMTKLGRRGLSLSISPD